MPVKREIGGAVHPVVSPGPKGMVKATLLEVQFREGRMQPRRYNRYERRHPAARQRVGMPGTSGGEPRAEEAGGTNGRPNPFYRA